jgi:hypothetical protein
MPEHERGGFEEDLRHQAKTKVWLDTLEKVERMRDALGFPVDTNIRETIVALNLSGLSTSASCEGHIDRGRGAPWIKIEAPNRPRERFGGQDEIIETTARKNKVSAEDVRTGRSHEAWREAMNLAADHEETPEYQIWRKENDRLQEQVTALLDSFYQGRTVEPAAHLALSRNAEGTFNIHNGGEDYERHSRTPTEDERRRLADRLARYQGEMKVFTDFLREKYYSSQ